MQTVGEMVNDEDLAEAAWLVNGRPYFIFTSVTALDYETRHESSTVQRSHY